MNGRLLDECGEPNGYKMKDSEHQKECSRAYVFLSNLASKVLCEGGKQKEAVSQE